MNNYLSRITLNVNGLNVPIKRHRIAEWIRKQDPQIMLPTGDPPQNKRPTQTESEGLETNIPNKWTGKRRRVQQYPYQTKYTFKKAITRDPEGHFIILKERTHQEDINIVNIYAPNIGTAKYIKKILEDFKKDIESNIVIVVDFNTPLSKMDRSSNKISTKILWL